MATVYALQGIASTVTDSINNFELFDPTKFSQVGPTEIGQDGSREVLYQNTEGDMAYPTQVRIGVYPKGNSPKVWNVSVRMTTYMSKTVDTVLDSYEPASCVLAWTLPWVPVHSETEMKSLILNTVSWIFHSVATGALGTGLLSNLEYAIPEVDLSAVART